MKEYFHIVEKYGFKAPLASLEPDFNIKDFIRTSKTLETSDTTMKVITEVIIALEAIDERIASLSHLSDILGKGVHVIRNHLTKLEHLDLATTEFVTTDPIRKRRGKHYILRIPTNKEIASHLVDKDAQTQQYLPSIAQSVVTKVPNNLQDYSQRFLELRVVRYIVKAMRTNRKDQSTKISVDVRFDPHKPPVKIVSRSSEGRIAYLPDLTYYCSALTWLMNHIQELSKHKTDIGETFTLPLEPLIALSKGITVSEAKSGGYTNNAIASIKRLSDTTFDMSSVSAFIDIKNVTDVELFYTLFRLESIVTYTDDNGHERKAVTLQFPKWIVQSITSSVKEKRTFTELLMFDTQMFSTKNEIEILFNLWAKDVSLNSGLRQKFYSWNEFRELVAPTSTLVEFKRKFSAFFVANNDPAYNPVISPARVDQSFIKKGTSLLSGSNESNYCVEYGRASIGGLIVNIGFSDQHNTTVLSFRQELSVKDLGSRQSLLFNKRKTTRRI